MWHASRWHSFCISSLGREKLPVCAVPGADLSRASLSAGADEDVSADVRVIEEVR